MADVIVFGASDLAEVVAYYLSHDAGHRVPAFTVDGAYLKESRLSDRPVVPFEELSRTYSPDRFKLLVAIGYRRVNRLRADKCRAARSAGYQLVSYVSTRATVADNVPMGDNCIILEGNHVQPYARLGSNVVMLSGNLVSHHTSIGDDCFLAGGCAIGGRVTLGRGCFVGLNATVRNLIAVGDDCVVGAGAVLLESSPPAAVYRAEPARRLDIASDTMDDL